MKHSQSFWRVLFFVSMIAVLCSGLAAPAGNTPARAAPVYQLACGLVMAQWNFDNLSTGLNSSPTYSSLAIDVASATSSVGSGLPSPTISTTTPNSSPNSWFSNNFASTGGTLNPADNDYFQFVIDTTNYSGINLNFYATRSGQGPTTMQVHYSTDGTNFTALTGTYSIADSVYPASPFTADLTGLTNTAGTTFIRIYGWNAGGGGGTGRIDDVTFTGCQPATPTPTSTDTGTPTNTGTPTDTGTPTSTGAPTSTGTPTFTPTSTSPSGSATNIVISEFRTSAGSGAATNEYIELYNPTSNWIDISGWEISASNSSGDVQTRATIPASTILRAGQYYLVAHTGYVTINSVSPNLTYGTGISDNGGIALLNLSDQIIDEVGMDLGSAYWETDPLSPLSSTNRSYERKVGDPGSAGSCVDTNDNTNDFASEPPTPHNYSTIRLCNGNSGPGVSNTATNITADSPDPSLVNGNVIVSVSVTGGSTTPSGRVNITGANSNCSITLSSSGTGSCTVKFTSTGTKTLTATYLGDNTHWNSSDTESHTVTTSSGGFRTPTPTRVPTLPPPPPLIGINEFVPRPGHDWNNDGVINTNDEYIELINHGVIDVNLSGYSLDDEVNIGSTPYRLPSITLKPGERRVFYGSETGLLLSDGGDGVRLLKPNGQLGDAYNYSVVRFPDQAYCRLPDNGGLDDWNQNCFPTPGLQNSQSASSVNPPTSGNAENLCPVADTLPNDFVLAECLPFGNNIFNPAYWDRFGWFNERYLPESTGKWPVFVD